MELPCWREYKIDGASELERIPWGRHPLFINLESIDDSSWEKIAEELQVFLKTMGNALPYPAALVTGIREKAYFFPNTICVNQINDLPQQYFYRTQHFGRDQVGKYDRLTLLTEVIEEKKELSNYFKHMREVNTYRSENLELSRILFEKE